MNTVSVYHLQLPMFPMTHSNTVFMKVFVFVVVVVCVYFHPRFRQKITEIEQFHALQTRLGASRSNIQRSHSQNMAINLDE